MSLNGKEGNLREELNWMSRILEGEEKESVEEEPRERILYLGF